MIDSFKIKVDLMRSTPFQTWKIKEINAPKNKSQTAANTHASKPFNDHSMLESFTDFHSKSDLIPLGKLIGVKSDLVCSRSKF